MSGAGVMQRGPFLHAKGFQPGVHFWRAARGGCSVVRWRPSKLSRQRERENRGAGILFTLHLPSGKKKTLWWLLFLLLPPPSFFVSFCHSLVLLQWQQQWSCLNDFTGYYSDTQLLTFQFCHFVATQKVHFSSIMFWELCQWAVMAFNINLIINNYIICGRISTSIYCVILQYRFWKGRPSLSKSSLD